MTVTPVVGVGGKKTWHHTDRSHAVKLILTRYLGVDHYMAGIVTWGVLLRLRDSHKDVVDGGVTVAMQRELVTSAVKLGDLLGQLLQLDIGEAAVVLVAMVGHVVGVTQEAGVTLDTAVSDKLNCTQIDEVRQQALAEAQAIADGCEGILEQGWRIPETVEHNALVVRFMRESMEARLRWADDAQAKLEIKKRGAEADAEGRTRAWYQEEVCALRALVAEQRD